MSSTDTSQRRTRTPLRVRAPYADFRRLGGRIGSGALGSGQGGVARCHA
ncbi:MAG TPA: hypothetical protein VFH77_12420 [Streptomyces sp.]|jgi:hypothetical protein|nr:hypothetical protein [Streptomyces sp.]